MMLAFYTAIGAAVFTLTCIISFWRSISPQEKRVIFRKRRGQVFAEEYAFLSSANADKPNPLRLRGGQDPSEESTDPPSLFSHEQETKDLLKVVDDLFPQPESSTETQTDAQASGQKPSSSTGAAESNESSEDKCANKKAKSTLPVNTRIGQEAKVHSSDKASGSGNKSSCSNGTTSWNTVNTACRSGHRSNNNFCKCPIAAILRRYGIHQENGFQLTRPNVRSLPAFRVAKRGKKITKPFYHGGPPRPKPLKGPKLPWRIFPSSVPMTGYAAYPRYTTRIPSLLSVDDEESGEDDSDLEDDDECDDSSDYDSMYDDDDDDDDDDDETDGSLRPTPDTALIQQQS